MPGAKVEVRRVDDRDALYYRIPSTDSLKAQVQTGPSGAPEKRAQPVRPGSSAKALSSARRRLLPSLLCLRAIDGMSIRTALPFRSSNELSSSSISTFPSLDDVHIQRGHYAQNAPGSLAELLRALPGVGGPHRPMLNVQITIFEDGLLALLSAPAFFLDAAGAQEVMRAWSAILREADAAAVPHLRGTVENTLLSALLADPTPVPLTNAKTVPPYGFLRYAWSWRLLLLVREAWERLIAHRPSSLEAREIWVPEGVVRELMAQARKDLLDEGHEPDEEEGRVDREHVLLAWLLQVSGRSHSRLQSLRPLNSCALAHNPRSDPLTHHFTHPRSAAHDDVQSMNRGKEKRAKLVSVLAPVRLSALARSHSSERKNVPHAHYRDDSIHHIQGQGSVGAAASFPTGERPPDLRSHRRSWPNACRSWLNA